MRPLLDPPKDPLQFLSGMKYTLKCGASVVGKGLLLGAGLSVVPQKNYVNFSKWGVLVGVGAGVLKIHK